MTSPRAGLSVLLLAFLGACGIGTPASTASPPSWLLNPVCAIPCWEGVKPAELRYEDVIPVLQSHGIRATERLGKEITFQMGETAGSVTRDENGKVGAVILFFPHESISMDNLVAQVGAPQELVANIEPRNTRKCTVTLLHAQSGTIAEAYLENARPESGDCDVTITQEFPCISPRHGGPHCRRESSTGL